MENTPRQEKPTESPFDFSKYTQPEVAEPSSDDAFDFSEYQGGQKSFEEVTEEINEHNRLTKTYDFSDENIASGGPIQRDLTPAEIAENSKAALAAEQLAQSKRKFGSNIARKFFRRG